MGWGQAEALKRLAVRQGTVDADALGTHRATYDYVPQNEGDMEIKIGDVITLKEDNGDGWANGTPFLSVLRRRG
jgi:hypothetical protein